MTLHFTVRPEEDALALRDVLRRRGCSASLLAAVKRGQGFWRAGAPIFANERVRAGDEIAVPLPPDAPSDVTPQDLPLAIVYETAHAMVLEKPAGMVVHPTLGAKDGTLANAFCGLMQRRGTPAPFRPVNRLDRGTSGLVLCAMNAWAAPLLAKSVRKEYLAAVRGVPQPKEGAWRWPIARCEDSIIKRRCAEDGKPSVTHYSVVGVDAQHDAALLRCVLETGRTHQIRVHAARAGHPLLGDWLYGGDTAAIARPALHCSALCFEDPETGRHIVCKSAPSFTKEWLILHTFAV